jgi:hypothetical protein
MASRTTLLSTLDAGHQHRTGGAGHGFASVASRFGRLERIDIASSQGHFDSSEYHRQLERGCRNHNKPSANADSSDAGQLIRINEIVLQCDATLHYNVVHEDGSIQLAFI